MNGSLINWLLAGISTVVSLLLALCLWVVKEHARNDEKQFELIRQRLHDAMNDIEGVKAVLRMREKERK